MSNHSELSFSLIRSKSYPQRGLLLLAVRHMTVATLPYAKWNEMNATDLAITLVEDLMFRSFKTQTFRPQAGRFSVSWWNSVGSAPGMLRPKEGQALARTREWEAVRGRLMDPAELPERMTRMMDHVELDERTAASKGVSYQGESCRPHEHENGAKDPVNLTGDPHDVIAVLSKISVVRSARAAGSVRTPKQADTTIRMRAAAQNAKRTETVPGPTYAAFCACGFKSTGELTLVSWVFQMNLMDSQATNTSATAVSKYVSSNEKHRAKTDME